MIPPADQSFPQPEKCCDIFFGTSAANERKPAEIRIEYVDPRRTVKTRESFTIEFILDLETGGVKYKPITGLGHVMVSVTRMPGNRPQRLTAAEVGEGCYSVNMNVKDPGDYYVFVPGPSLQVDSAQMT